MLELFVTMLPLQTETERERLSKILGGANPLTLLYSIQYSLFSETYQKKKFDELENYFDFLVEAINYAKKKTNLMPDVDPPILKEFENRLIVVQKQLEKKEK